MIVIAWRITKRKHARNAFSGEGARQFGGRWNSPGVAVVYTAGSQSLAALEMLVHLESSELLQNYLLLPVQIEDRLIATLGREELPKHWRANPPPPKLREIGDAWTLSGKSVALRVPSAVVPAEYLYILNPRHPHFSALRIGEPVPFGFDPRLAR